MVLLIVGLASGVRADDRADRLWDYVEQLRAQGPEDKILPELYRFAEDHPTDPRVGQVLRQIAAIHEDEGRVLQAIDVLDRLLRDHPESKDAAYAGHHLATLLGDQGRWDDTIDALRRTLRDHPAYDRIEDAQLDLARALVRRGSPEDARRMLGRMVGSRASCRVTALAQRELAELDLAAEDSTAAIRRLEAVPWTCQDHSIAAEARLRAAEVHRVRGRIEAARDDFEEVLENVGRRDLRVRSLVGLAETIEAVDPVAASDAYRRALDEDPSVGLDERARHGLARTLLRIGATADARREAERGLDRHPQSRQSEELRLLAARAGLRDGRRDAREDLLVLSRSADPEIAHVAAVELAQDADDRESFEEALQFWRTAERRASRIPWRVDALLGQAGACRRIDRPDLGSDLALTAHDMAERPEQRAQALLLATQCFAMSGDRARAVATAHRVVSEHPLTEAAMAAREAIRVIERQRSLDPRSAARELTDLAEHEILDFAQRSYEVAVIQRDRLGNIDGALDLLDQAIAQASRPEQRGRFELEYGRTLLLQAFLQGLEGDTRNARRIHRRAHDTLVDAAQRADTEHSAQHARVLLIGLELARRVRPETPWAFDGWTLPVLGGLGAVERVDLTSADFDTVRTMIRKARRHADTRDQKAWLLWRQAEMVREPVAVRLELAREALSTAPSAELEPSIRFTLGQLLLRSGDLERASREFMRSVDAMPVGEVAVAARFGLAEVHRRRGDHLAAVRAYDEVATLYPDSERGHYALLVAGDCSFYAGSIVDAELRYRRLLDRAPSSVHADDAMYRLGVLLVRSGRLEAARDPLEKLVRSAPHSAFRGRALGALGRIEAAQGDRRAAIDAYAEWIRVEGRVAARYEAWATIARWELEETEPQAAMLWLDRRLSHREPDPVSLELRTRAFASGGDVHGAAAVVRRLEGGFPDAGGAITRARLALAAAYRGSNQLEQAVDLAERARSDAPDDTLRARASFEKGVAYARMEFGREAVDAWNTALQVAPTTIWAANALHRWAEWSLHREDLAGAQSRFAAFAARYPDDRRRPEALAAQASTLRAMGRHEEALTVYQTIVETFAESVVADAALVGVAACHLELGQPETAEVTLRRVLPYLGSSQDAVEAHGLLAVALEELGRDTEAAAQHLEVAQMHPGGSKESYEAQLAAADALERAGALEEAAALFRRVGDEVGPRSYLRVRAYTGLQRLEETFRARR